MAKQSHTSTQEGQSARKTSRLRVFVEKYYLLVICLTALFYNFYYHVPRNWDDAIWSDQEGYYVYLPATFMYEDFKNVPVKSCCGTSDDGKLTTKYTSGVAIMELPFFLMVHAVVSMMDVETNGLDGPYALVIMLSGVFYVTVGSYLLRKFLLRYYTPFIASLTVLLVFLGTNLFFYSVRQPGMSHVYSYFFFASFLHLLCKIIDEPKAKWFVLFGLTFGMICLIRPTNIVLGLFVLFFETRSLQEVKKRVSFILKHWKYVLFALVACLMVAIPQMIYWKNVYGSFITYSYSNDTSHEGFPNWNSPEILNVLFSHQNGWFPYTPMAAVMLVGVIWMAVKKQLNGRLILGVVVIILYILSSWHQWWFGGSFGYRSMVEYYVLLSIPLAFILTKVQKSESKKLKRWTVFFCVFFVLTNIRMVEWYHAPWNGDDWTWGSYLHVWLRAFGLADVIPH